RRACAARLPAREASAAVPRALGGDGQPRSARGAREDSPAGTRRADLLRAGLTPAGRLGKVRRFMTRWLWRASWLLLPVAFVARLIAPDRHVLVFSLSCLSLMPLAKAMGDATEDLAERLGPGPGAILNASFGNAAELIVALLALSKGHVALVKGSITGSILGNLLLIAGGAVTVA